jgi:hypothetical protein
LESVVSEFRTRWERDRQAEEEFNALQESGADDDAVYDAEDAWTELSFGLEAHPLMSWHWNYDATPSAPGYEAFLEAVPDDGLPLPIARLGRLSRLPIRLVDPPDITAARAATLAAADETQRDCDDLATAERLLVEWADSKSREVTALFRSLLLDAPELSLQVRPARDWFAGNPLRWEVRAGKYRAIGLEELSRAEQRWAAIAIVAVLDWDSLIDPFIPVVWLMDEPETALHRSAEVHMAKGLVSLASHGAYWLVATHCPALLDSRATQQVRVFRSAGTTRTRPMLEEEFKDLAALGMTPSDLLARIRGFLLVEGHHDEVVLGALIGSQLHNERIYCVQVGGAKQLAATLESRLIYDFTEARVFTLVDNMEAARLASLWEQALVIAATDAPRAAGEFLRRELPRRESGENKFMTQFMSRAIEKGSDLSGRVTPCALSRPDIPEYLSVGELIPETDMSWRQLHREHEADPGHGLRFKPWLERKFRRPIFTDEALLKAARGTQPPEEFEALVETMRRVLVDPADPQVGTSGSTS